MTQTEPTENTAQDKLRKIIREEMVLINKTDKKINKPLLAGAIGLIIGAMAGAVAYTSNNSQGSLAVESSTTKDQKEPAITVSYPKTNPLEFIVASHAALVFFEDSELDVREVSMALELFSKRNAADIGEPLGLVREKAIGTLLDPEIMLDVFARTIDFLKTGVNDPTLELDYYQAKNLSEDPLVRKERLIQKINKVVNNQASPEKIIKQLTFTGQIFTENGRFSGEEDIERRESYKRTQELIISRVDPRR